jgi:hypothetical protein
MQLPLDSAARIRNYRNLKSLFSHGIVFLLGVFAISMFRLERFLSFTTRNQLFPENPKNIPGFARRDLAVNYPGMVDKRLEIIRPFMNTTSRMIIDSIYDIERKYEPDSECNQWGGSKFMEDLEKSGKSIVHGGTSNILSFRNKNMDVYFGQNVSVVVTMQGDYTDETKTQPIFGLEVDGRFKKPVNKRLYSIEQESTLGKMGLNTLERNGIEECTEYIEYPVLLVDNTINTW